MIANQFAAQNQARVQRLPQRIDEGGIRAYAPAPFLNYR